MCIRKTLTEVRNSCTSVCRHFSNCQLRLEAMNAALAGIEDQPSLRWDNPHPVVVEPERQPTLSLVASA